jgi:hypothetical protein
MSRGLAAHESPETHPLDRLMAIADTVGQGPEAVDVQVRALADPRTLTGDGVDWELVDKAGNRRDLQGEALAGHVCLITAGRGLGHYRFVESLRGDTLTLDRPWDLLPGAGAEFVVSTSSIENLILNNTDRDGDAGMQIWGGCIANVISGHISEDTNKILSQHNFVRVTESENE